MIIIFYGVLALASLAAGLYARIGSPPPRFRKWLLPRQRWFTGVAMAVLYVMLAAQEGVKMAQPRFYAAHEGCSSGPT